MPLEHVKAIVDNFINDTHSDLLVIRGDWGTGKTYFWRKCIEDNIRRGSVGRGYYSYVSLFGIDSLAELKNAILASRVDARGLRSASSWKDFMTTCKNLFQRAESIPKIQEYIGSFSSEVFYYFLDDTLVCFDDIERRGNGLDLKDVFGIASDLKEQRGCKVLFILNDEALGEDSLNTFKLHGEKIIDRNIRFAIPTEEAFDYIFQSSFVHYEVIRQCCSILHIRNIRILERIKRLIEDLIPLVLGLEKSVSENAIRSLVLYIWCYYDRSEGVPPLSYVLEASFAKRLIRAEYKKEEITPDEKIWDGILNSYNYATTDDVDRCLADYVSTGFVNSPQLKQELIKKNDIAKMHQSSAAFSQVWHTYYRTTFDNNEDSFISALIDGFRSNMQALSLSDLHETAVTLREFGQDEYANTLIDEYIDTWRRNNGAEKIRKFQHHPYLREFKDEYFRKRLNETLGETLIDTRPLRDVLNLIAFKDSYDYGDIRHMNSFSEEDYYRLFKSADLDDLYLSVRTCLDFLGINDPQGVYTSIGMKAKAALIRIASESRINKMRVTKLYQLDIE